ncbi:MAG: Mg2+ and Co2+ transporter CorA [Rickettsiales bacterium]|jgi:Mg2+ and Co2+ transporter CorA
MNTDSLLELVKTVGLSNTIFLIILLSCHFFIFRLYNERLKDRQDEIDRLAEENHQYRDRFLKLMDNKFNFSNKKEGK